MRRGGRNGGPAVRFFDVSPVDGIMTQFLCYRRDPNLDENGGSDCSYDCLNITMPPGQWEASPLTLSF